MTFPIFLNFFPWDLFLIFFSATLFIRLCQETGIFDHLTHIGLRFCGEKKYLIPLLVFALAFSISFIGAGNIAATALIAPAALSMAKRLKLSTFAMSLVVIGGVNSAVMSPFAPTGILTRQIVSKYLPSILSLDVFIGKLFWPSFLVTSIVHLCGFLLFGGMAWMFSKKESVSIASLIPKTDVWNNSQRIALFVLFLFFALNLIFGVDEIIQHLPQKLHVLKGELAYIALFCSIVAVALKMASLTQALKDLPWDLLFLICGISFILSLVEHYMGFGLITHSKQTSGSFFWIVLILSFFAGLLSVFSSSSGVVLPLFLPLIPAFSKNMGDAANLTLVTSVIVASHLVDCSPFSSLGALCIANEKSKTEQAKRLFRKLLRWGLAMVLVGAFMCALFAYLNLI